MVTKFLDNSRNVSPDCISSGEDSNLRPGWSINGPPADEKCDCCGRHISELEPFEEYEEFFSFLFDGQFLEKRYRPSGPYVAEADRAVNEAEEHLANPGHKDQDVLEWMRKKYGKEKGKNLYFSYMAYTQFGSSLECKDCFYLGLDEYWEKYYKSLT
jgi:hypothetical protein